MSNKFVSQYVADGVLTTFIFDFDVVQGRSVNVYDTLAGVDADEESDLVSNNAYVVVFDTPSASASKGNVIFNVAPSSGSIITITPDGNTNVTVDFSNTTPLNQDNLNKSYDQQSSTISQDFENHKVSSLRYNINENESNIDYSNILSPLADKSFWRREGANIISQDFDEFVGEVAADVSANVKDQVNASAENTNISADVAASPINTPISGDIFKVDIAGQVYVYKTLTNIISALAGSHWAKEWAVSDVQISDDYGNIGFSSKYYSGLADIAATATSGLIDELYAYNPSLSISTVDLVQYEINEPWIDVLENSFTVYIDGKMVQSPLAYSENGPPTGGTYSYTVDIKANPTLAAPSSITITPAVPPATQILISRGAAQGDSSTMFATGSNYKPTSPDSKIANRDLSNILPTTETLKIITDILFPVGSVLIRNVNPSLNGFAGTWGMLSNNNAVTTTTFVGSHNSEKAGNSLNNLVAVDGEALTIAQIPSHSHGIGTVTGAGVSKRFPGVITGPSIPDGNVCESIGGNEPHNHGLNIATVKLMHWIRTA